jgi:hypothetical protein
MRTVIIVTLNPIISVIDLRRMQWVTFLAHRGEMTNAYQILSQKF